jgi:FAD synthetase
MRTVLVFGVFDGIHDGHRAFFTEARKHGDRLVIAVAQDAVVVQLKGKPPRRPLGERLAALRGEPGIDEAVAGDDRTGSWGVLERYKPDVIALGYDQEALTVALEAVRESFSPPPELKVMQAHRPDVFHNALRK